MRLCLNDLLSAFCYLHPDAAAADDHSLSVHRSFGRGEGENF